MLFPLLFIIIFLGLVVEDMYTKLGLFIVAFALTAGGLYALA